jgi:hypothetical protein
MLKHEFQRDVVEKQVFRRMQDRRQAFLLFFRHGTATVAAAIV